MASIKITKAIIDFHLFTLEVCFPNGLKFVNEDVTNMRCCTNINSAHFEVSAANKKEVEGLDIPYTLEVKNNKAYLNGVEISMSLIINVTAKIDFAKGIVDFNTVYSQVKIHAPLLLNQETLNKMNPQKYPTIDSYQYDITYDSWRYYNK